jgi:hypothetical protein
VNSSFFDSKVGGVVGPSSPILRDLGGLQRSMCAGPLHRLRSTFCRSQ